VKINVAGIKDVSGSSKTFSSEVDGASLAISEDTVLFTQPLTISGTATNNGQSIMVQGTLETAVQMICGACLETFSLPLHEKFLDEFVEGVPAADFDTQAEDAPGFFQGDEIPLDELIRDVVLLALPMRPVCHDTCKGLCSKCGQNLNQAVCNCQHEAVDPRLSVLKKLLDQE
jgi:uncharacterized protein